MTSLTKRRIRLAATCLTTTLASAAVGFIFISTASAHTDLLSVVPADGSTISTPPEEVVLTFNENLLNTGTKVVITNQNKTIVAKESARAVGRTAVMPWAAELPNDTYTVSYRVVSTDGHPITGTTTFTLLSPNRSPSPTEKSAAPISPSPDAIVEPSGASSLTDPNVLIGAAIGTIGGIGIVLVQRRRKKARQQE
ncbi:MAG: copper resistance protein CopC [Actinomycetota bacterium]|nr:copper resistance protein CopC [Actinomycetota bacterium]